MQIESKIRNIKGRTSYLNQRPRRTKSTCASSPFDSAKVVRNTETAKRNLETGDRFLFHIILLSSG